MWEFVWTDQLRLDNFYFCHGVCVQKIYVEANGPLDRDVSPSFDDVEIHPTPAAGSPAPPAGVPPTWHFKVPKIFRSSQLAVVVYNPAQKAVATQNDMETLRDGVKKCASQVAPRGGAHWPSTFQSLQCGSRHCRRCAEPRMVWICRAADCNAARAACGRSATSSDP